MHFLSFNLLEFRGWLASTGRCWRAGELKSRTGHFRGKGHNTLCEGYDGRSSSVVSDTAVLLPIC